MRDARRRLDRRVQAKPPTGSQVEALPEGERSMHLAGVVTTRPNESVQAWRKRVRIAQNVAKFGIRVRCDGCHELSRHYPKEGPLRENPCKCGGRRKTAARSR